MKVTTVEIPIFVFHDIVDVYNSERTDSKLPEIYSNYSEKDLELFLEYLVVNNYWFLSAQDVYNYYIQNKTIPLEHQKQSPVMIAFDDGYDNAQKNTLAIAEKIEQKYHQKIKVVWFINPGFMGHRGTRLKHANCEDFRFGFARGFYDLQSHGLNHQDLTKIGTKELDRELGEAQKVLRNCVKDLDKDGLVAAHFAYPFGSVNERVEQYVGKYYLSGYLHNSRIFKPKYLKNKYRISRLTVSKSSNFQKLKLLARGGWL